MNRAVQSILIATLCLVVVTFIRMAMNDGPSQVHAAYASASPISPVSSASSAVAGSEVASVDDDIRFFPTSRPSVPAAQHPPLATTQNVDTGKPPHEWQRMTDDWFGLRPKLDDSGISFQGSFTGDYGKTISGGLDAEKAASRYLLNANLTLDTERLFNLTGGTVFVSLQNHGGGQGADSAGSIQSISTIDAPNFTEISELWYEQKLLGDKLRLKIGKVDANSEFAHADYTDDFLNGAFGASPAIVGLPTYPDPAMSVNAFVKPNDHYYVGLGVYDGSTAAGDPTGTRGPGKFFTGSDYFWIGEAGLTWTTPGGLDGRLAAGVWHHTADFARFDGGTDHGTTGPYLTFNHALWRKNPDQKDDDQRIGFFGQYARADSQVSQVTQQAAGGFAWTGALPHRDDDVLGLGVSWADLSDHASLAHSNETAVELFYRVRLTAWLSLTPDLQYIHDPAFAGTSNAVAGTVRLVADF